MSLRKLLALIVTLAAFVPAAWAQGGPRYQTLSPPQPTEGGGKIEVVEFFWYGCPHCYSLEPEVVAWLKTAPKDVVFTRIPAVAPEHWAQAASIYYTLEAMGILEQNHQKVFDAFHKEGLNLARTHILDEWLKKHGIDVAKYHEVEKSFTVSTKLNRARQMTANYKVDSVPRVFVNGRHYPTVESIKEVFPVVNQLVDMSRREMAPAPAAPKAAPPKAAAPKAAPAEKK